MDLDDLKTYLLARRGATEELPFGPEVLVYKVAGKMFALVAWQERPLTVSLKCEPGQALVWRAVYPAVRPGYHLNKTHWNTLILDGRIPTEDVREMIDHSYERVVAGLTRKQRALLDKEV